jgi:hypothetical protein
MVCVYRLEMLGAARAKKVGQILAIRNVFGVGPEGVSSVSNNLSLAIRSGEWSGFELDTADL